MRKDYLMCSDKKNPACQDYEDNKKYIEGQNLPPDEYEKAIKELAERMGF